MKIIVCKYCGKNTKKYERDGSLFCNRKCYMDWKKNRKSRKPYKGRIFISKYWYLYMPTHPNAIKNGRYIAEHRYILEQKIGRLLTKSEIAHHINGDTSDNRPENIELLSFSEHSRMHALKRNRDKYGKLK